MAGYAKMLILPFLNVSKYISMHKQTKALLTQAFLNPSSDRNMKAVFEIAMRSEIFSLSKTGRNDCFERRKSSLDS